MSLIPKAFAPDRIINRDRLEDADPHVKRVLARLVEASTAGDPMSYLLWTNTSTRNLADELAATRPRPSG